MLEIKEYFYRANLLKKWMDPCILCARRCNARRLHQEVGFCGNSGTVRIATALPHRGEEPPLIGGAGSGAIFFSGCPGRCCYCQNHQISWMNKGYDLSPRELSDIFLRLQHIGCSNINLVTPTPHIPFIVEALGIARSVGLHIPTVFNTNSYISSELVNILDGIFEIYLPDFKYGQNIWAEKLSKFPDYFDVCSSAITTMVQQNAPLLIDPEKNRAVSGVLVRHLVLPGGFSGTSKVIETLTSISPHIAISLMAQYSPLYKSGEFPPINRNLYLSEYENAVELLRIYNVEHAYVQIFSHKDEMNLFIPDFNKKEDCIFPGNNQTLWYEM